MKNILRTLLAAGLLAGTAQAKVSFSLDIERIGNGAGDPISNSGLLVLVVDADNDDIDLPTTGSFGEDVIASWDLSVVGPQETAITLFTEDGVIVDPDWDAGEKLALLWFPNLSDGEVPSSTEEYGIFSDSSGLTSGNAWEMPADGTLLHSLKLFTAGASALFDGGELPTGAGIAAFSVDSGGPSDPIAPSSVALENDGSTIRVTWTNDGTSLGYIIQRRREGSSEWVTVGFGGPGETSFPDDVGIDPGIEYTYQVLAFGGVEVFASAVMPTIESLRSQIVNLASRAVMGVTPTTSRGIGFSVTGSEPMPVLIQAVGPSMGGGLPKPLDTELTFLYGVAPPGLDREIAVNDNWDDDPVAGLAILAAQDEYGAKILNDAAGDSALIAEVSDISGGYTNKVVDPIGGGGISSVQVYDINYGEDNPKDARLTGLSTRGVAGIGEESMRASFIIYGDVPMTVIVRVKGPSLRDNSPSDPWTSETVLDDPMLTLLQWNTSESRWDDFGTNDDWETRSDGSTAQEIAAADSFLGLVPFNPGSKDSLYMAQFNPGQYTAIVEGVDDEVGTVTVEIYEVPSM